MTALHNPAWDSACAIRSSSSGSRSKRIVNTAFPDITWEHSHVVVQDDGRVRTFCVYSAPDEAMVRDHSKELGEHVIDVIHEIAGDVSPEDLPDS